MTKSEINRELEKVYKEMSRWRELNKEPGFKFTKREKERREAFFFLREALCKIIDAKEVRNKVDEYYHTAFFYMIKFSQEQARS